MRSGWRRRRRVGLPELAAELVRSKVDVIVAVLTPAVTAAKNATFEIPIVMAPAGDPVGTGLIESLARPGGNLTGVSGTGTEIGAKNLELIREVVPSANRVAVLAHATDPFTKGFLELVERGAKLLRMELRTHMIRGGDDFEPAFAAMVREGSAAVLIQGSIPARPAVDLAIRHRLPALSNQKVVASAGGLMSYSASYEERGRARHHSITSLAATSRDCGTITPRALAVFRLITNSNLVDCIIGSSAGRSPRSTLPI